MIIGLSGCRGSGKDFAFSVLNSKYKVKRIAFADPIKEHICDIFNISLEELEFLKRQDKLSINNHGNFSGRHLIDTIGMKMRSYDDRQFNRYVEDKVLKNPDIDFICTDVRFENEIETIHKLNGKIILIVNEHKNYTNEITDNKITNYDYVIKNDMTSNYADSIVKLFNDVKYND